MANEWKLPLAPEKSCCLVIGGRNVVSLPDYKLQNSTLRVVDEVRDLGFLIRKNLNFDAHYKSLVKMANFRTYNIFKVLKSNNPDLLLRAYKSYVRPIAEFGTTVFNPLKKKDIDMLERIQNNFTRKAVMRCFGMDYSQIPNGRERNRMLGLKSLECRRQSFDLKMLLKILTQKVHINPCIFFRGHLSRTRRGKLQLYVPVARTTVRSTFLTYRSLREFNLLLAQNENLLGLSEHSLA